MPDAHDGNVAVHSDLTTEGSGGTHLCDPHLAFVTPQLQRAMQVWDAKRGQRTMPARADFSMRDLSFALPHVCTLAVVREGERTRFLVRMMGSQLDVYVGPMTGRFVDEAVPKKFAEKWSAHWHHAVETRRAYRSAGRVEFGGKNYYVAESLYAPLGVDGEHPDGLLLATYFHLWQSDQPEQSEIARQLLREIEAAG